MKTKDYNKVIQVAMKRLHANPKKPLYLLTRSDDDGIRYVLTEKRIICLLQSYMLETLSLIDTEVNNIKRLSINFLEGRNQCTLPFANSRYYLVLDEMSLIVLNSVSNDTMSIANMITPTLASTLSRILVGSHIGIVELDGEKGDYIVQFPMLPDIEIIGRSYELDLSTLTIHAPGENRWTT